MGYRLVHVVGKKTNSKAKIEDQAANVLMSAKGFSDYVAKNGYHFTDKLADHVTMLLDNANSEEHNWTTEQVKTSLRALGFNGLGKNRNKLTYGDIAYMANLYYSDLYPEVIKEETSCLKGAYKMANDPDGYDGIVFCRWTSDAIGKAISIDWEKFI